MEVTTRSQLRRSTLLEANVSDEGRTKPIISADYIVGLTDGEGCFYVLVRQPHNENGGSRAELHFYIKMQEEDRAILESVRETLRCGAVYFQHETRKNHTQCYRYTVSSHRDILEKDYSVLQDTSFAK